jgi:riboflavin transporter FmnP
MKLDTTILAGTAALSSLAVVFDYALKYSNLKIPFPWLPYLKFDFTGIPIVVSALLFGLIPGIFTSAVASVAILARSGDIIGSTSKGLAEFSTIIGMLIGLKMFSRFRPISSVSTGLASRVLIMTVVNLALVYTGLVLLPSVFNQAAFAWVLTVGLFNVAEGAISAVGGYVVFQAIKIRAPYLIERSNKRRFSASVGEK